MSRQYRILYLSDQQKACQILGAIGEVDGIRQAAFTNDLKELKLELENGKVTAAMDQVVNICAKLVDGCELHYKFI